MDIVAYQQARRLSEVGLGAMRSLPSSVRKPRGPLGALAAIIGGGGRGGPVVAPPPGSPYWQPVGSQGAFWATALMQPAFRSAYNASRETLTQGTRGSILWRTWSYQGVWYATSRPNAMMMPQLFQFRPAAGAAGTPPIPAVGRTDNGDGVGDIQSRIAPYLDDQGMFDADSYGYDLGVGTAPTLDLSRWAAIPTTPDGNSPNWRALSAVETQTLQATRGWPGAVATAEQHGTPIFKFGRSWYKILPMGAGIQVLGGGSGSGGHRYFAGVSRSYALGATKSNFFTPTTSQWQGNPPSSTVSDAAVALLSYFSNHGVPYEGTQVTVVGTFQTAYDTEAAVTGLNSDNALLDADQKYGPNTRAALQSIIDAGGGGGTAPAPNTVAPTTPVPTPTPTPPTGAPSDFTIPIVVGSVVAGAALIGGSWWLATQQKARRGRALAA